MPYLGELNAGMIGNTVIEVAHEGARVKGMLTGLSIDTEVETWLRMNGDESHRRYDVDVTVTIGSVTIGPLRRDYPCVIEASDD